MAAARTQIAARPCSGDLKLLPATGVTLTPYNYEPYEASGDPFPAPGYLGIALGSEGPRVRVTLGLGLELENIPSEGW